jgi:hypothetical protein
MEYRIQEPLIDRLRNLMLTLLHVDIPPYGLESSYDLDN